MTRFYKWDQFGVTLTEVITAKRGNKDHDADKSAEINLELGHVEKLMKNNSLSSHRELGLKQLTVR